MNTPDGCGFCGVRRRALQRCGRCKREFYCSKVCQKLHWKDGHKNKCHECQKENQCTFCGQQSQNLLRCSRCKETFYCSRECQKQHWKAGHRQTCKELKYKPDIQSQSMVCCFCLTVANGLRKCTGCREVYYCSRDCQAKDWKQRHKNECQSTKNKVRKKDTPVMSAVDRTTVEHERENANGDKEMPLSMEICPVCGISGQLKSCQGCLTQKYCSTECQKVDWKKHKEKCLKDNKKTETEDISNKMVEPLAICSCCKQKNTSLSCSGCNAIYYCSKSCQKQDWFKHKLSCKSQRSKMKVKETLSIAVCQKLGLVTPEEHGGLNRNDGDKIEEDKAIFCSYLCAKCGRNKACVECPDCETVLYCSTGCRDLDILEHQSLCCLAQINRPLTGMSNTIGFGNGRMNVVNAPQHSMLPIDKNPLFVEDGANLNLIIERDVRARGKAEMKTLQRFPSHTLITRIREMPVEEKSMFGSNICRQPLVFLSYIRRFHRYRGRHNVYLQDADRREIYVSFYLPNDDPSPHFRWSDLVPGKFIAILFPCIHFFIDGTVGIRVDKASNVYCFDVKD